MNDREWNLYMIIEMTVLTVLMIGQIVLFFIFFHHGRYALPKYFGYACWIISALLGWLPIFEFRRKGGIPKGKAYVATTKVVTTGIYRIVRHPQYLAGIFLSLALILISQHWLVLIIGIPPVLILYKNTFDEDRKNISKFGNEYRRYMKRVPRLNIILGILRLFGSCGR